MRCGLFFLSEYCSNCKWMLLRLSTTFPYRCYYTLLMQGKLILHCLNICCPELFSNKILENIPAKYFCFSSHLTSLCICLLYTQHQLVGPAMKWPADWTTFQKPGPRPSSLTSLHWRDEYWSWIEAEAASSSYCDDCLVLVPARLENRLLISRQRTKLSGILVSVS